MLEPCRQLAREFYQKSIDMLRLMQKIEKESCKLSALGKRSTLAANSGST
jgi:hypothetical protein